MQLYKNEYGRFAIPGFRNNDFVYIIDFDFINNSSLKFNQQPVLKVYLRQRDQRNRRNGKIKD